MSTRWSFCSCFLEGFSDATFEKMHHLRLARNHTLQLVSMLFVCSSSQCYNSYRSMTSLSLLRPSPEQVFYRPAHSTPSSQCQRRCYLIALPGGGLRYDTPLFTKAWILEHVFRCATNTTSSTTPVHRWSVM